MRQRVMIAMALLLSPDLIVMDEPTSALDVVAQRSLMTKIKDLQAELGFAVVFVTHDMSTVARFSTHIGVMYAGTLVEIGPTPAVVGRPLHPYTRGLFEAYPDVYGEWRELSGIPGAPPDLATVLPGCPFMPRCSAAVDECGVRPPPPIRHGDSTVRCIRTEQLAGTDGR
jgi:peptide/nickel transport system ATP-binding protein